LVSKLVNATALMGNTEEWLPSGPPAGEGDTPERSAAIRRWWDWTIRLLPAEAVEWVEHLPRRLLLEHGKARLLGVHATARGLEDRLTPWDSDDHFAAAVETTTHTAIACAHIHMPYLRRVGGASVFNTGSAGRPIDGDPRSSYVLADVDPDGITSLVFRRVGYDIDATARLCNERDFPWTDEYIKALRVGANF
jgi:predicted phosphodiesterase